MEVKDFLEEYQELNQELIGLKERAAVLNERLSVLISKFFKDQG